MSYLDDIKLAVQLGALSVNDARDMLLEHDHGADYTPWDTAHAIWFMVLLVCGVVLGLSLELWLAWR